MKKEGLEFIKEINNNLYYKDLKRNLLIIDQVEKEGNQEILTNKTIVQITPATIKLFVEFIQLVKESQDKKVKIYEYLNTLPLSRYELINQKTRHILNKYHDKKIYQDDLVLDVFDSTEESFILKSLQEEDNFKLLYKRYHPEGDVETFTLYSFQEGFLKYANALFYYEPISRKRHLKEINIIPFDLEIAQSIIKDFFEKANN